jgi:hypothetical protein
VVNPRRRGYIQVFPPVLPPQLVKHRLIINARGQLDSLDFPNNVDPFRIKGGQF